MRYYNYTEYARIIGVTLSAVSQAVAAERIPTTSVGIDLTDRSVIDYAERRVSGKDRILLKRAIQDAFSETGQEFRGMQSVDAVSNGLSVNEVDFDHIEDNISDIAKTDIEKIKTIEMIRKLRFENARNRNEYILRDIVARTFYKLYSIDTSEFAMLANNAAPEIASICGIDDAEVIIKIQNYLEEQLYRTLDHIKYAINGFLRDVGKDEIDV